MASTRLQPPGLPTSASLAGVAAGVPGWGVYILRCADGTLYTGCTNDLKRRLMSHARRRVKYTRSRLPVALAYWEPVGTARGPKPETKPETPKTGTKTKKTETETETDLDRTDAKTGRSAALRREAAIKRLPRRTKLALCGGVKLC